MTLSWARQVCLAHPLSADVMKWKVILAAKLMAVAFWGSTAWSGTVGDPDPGDLVSMLDHAAIVEPMALAREATRPDLAVPFR